MLNFIQVMAWPVAIVIGSILIFVLVFSGKIKGLSASKEGGIKLETAVETINSRSKTKYSMDRRIAEIDSDTAARERKEVGKLRTAIIEAIAGAGLCTSLAGDRAGELRRVIYEAVEENNLKENLAQGKIDAYLAGKLAEIKEEFTAPAVPCPAGQPGVFVPWEDAAPKLKAILAQWAAATIAVLLDASEKKIAIYQEYRGLFEESHDGDFLSVVDDCISKNQGYIDGLRGVKDAA